MFEGFVKALHDAVKVPCVHGVDVRKEGPQVRRGRRGRDEGVVWRFSWVKPRRGGGRGAISGGRSHLGVLFVCAFQLGRRQPQLNYWALL